MSEIPLSAQEQRALYRRLVSQPQWLAYVGRFGPFHLRSPQNTWVTLFSSKEDLALAQAQTPEPIKTQAMSGFEPFALHLRARTGVSIDPASPGAIHFKKSQLAHLEVWGRGAWIERLLRHKGNEPWVVRQILEHPAFWVLVEGKGDHARWQRSRGPGKLGVALFVVPDAPYHFIEAQGLDQSKLRLLSFSGRGLLEAMSRSGGDSVVLNPGGPGESLEISRLSLEVWQKAFDGTDAQ